MLNSTGAALPDSQLLHQTHSRGSVFFAAGQKYKMSFPTIPCARLLIVSGLFLEATAGKMAARRGRSRRNTLKPRVI